MATQALQPTARGRVVASSHWPACVSLQVRPVAAPARTVGLMGTQLTHEAAFSGSAALRVQGGGATHPTHRRADYALFELFRTRVPLVHPTAHALPADARAASPVAPPPLMVTWVWRQQGTTHAAAVTVVESHDAKRARVADDAADTEPATAAADGDADTLALVAVLDCGERVVFMPAGPCEPPPLPFASRVVRAQTTATGAGWQRSAACLELSSFPRDGNILQLELLFVGGGASSGAGTEALLLGEVCVFAADAPPATPAAPTAVRATPAVDSECALCRVPLSFRRLDKCGQRGRSYSAALASGRRTEASPLPRVQRDRCACGGRRVGPVWSVHPTAVRATVSVCMPCVANRCSVLTP
jgi:hypothetical protein